MIDNPLTLGPELSSKLVGKSQGFDADSAENQKRKLCSEAVFRSSCSEALFRSSCSEALFRSSSEALFRSSSEALFRSSSEAVSDSKVLYASACKDEVDLLMAMNFVFTEGKFAEANTHWFDIKSGDAVVEYNVYVFHY
ncbi:hypothetical protein MTR_4g013340 [Medicago truncatula]|uniref:Uncharacterized protein n=1 Tax=Medicago truncatula TaxID=3880 RepID=A0A072UIA5_MEDTR|nr:hypothetical protein MTR_4g013340 [Medicago truncatula]